MTNVINLLRFCDLIIGFVLIVVALRIVRRKEVRLRFFAMQVRRSEAPRLFWAIASAFGGLGLLCIAATMTVDR